MKLLETDFVLLKDGKRVEGLDTIYSQESVNELLADGFKLNDGEQFVSMTALTYNMQQEYINHLKLNK